MSVSRRLSAPRAPRAGRSRALLDLAVLLLCAAALGLAGCGDDDEPAATGPAGGEAGLDPAPTTVPEESPAEPSPEPVPEPPEGSGSGGAEAPSVSDEGHEGGGPDPGTEEAESANVGGDQQDEPTGGAGPSPTEAFEQFCEENPEACE